MKTRPITADEIQRRTQYGKWVDTLQRMKVGDCLMVDLNEDEPSAKAAQASILISAKRLGLRVKTHAVSGRSVTIEMIGPRT